MSKPAPKSVALKFVEVINAGDSEELVKLQTEDFALIDMGGTYTVVEMVGKITSQLIRNTKFMCNMS